MIVLRLKGMEMPKSCGGCGLPMDLCDKWKTRNWGAPRPADCPLVEIPPHGRLIDADAFMRDECNSCDGACEAIPCDCVNCHADCRCEFMRDILDAPTIIPAEEN